MTSISPKPSMIRLDNLRNKGKQSLAKKQYKSAIIYYSAILQLLEGVNDERSTEMRRRCGLTIAECELRSRNYPSTIARCSEIIEDSLNELIKQESIEKEDPNPCNNFVRSILAAHEKRSNALTNLNLTDVANYDNKIASYLKSTNFVNKSKFQQLYSQQLESNIQLKDKLYDVVEDFQINYPRLELGENELNNILNEPTPSTSPQPLSQISNPFSGLNSLNGLGGLSGLGGFDVKKLLLDKEKISNLLNLLTGIDKKIVLESLEIVYALRKSFINLYSLYSNIIAQKEKIILGATLSWVAYYFFQQKI